MEGQDYFVWLEGEPKPELKEGWEYKVCGCVFGRKRILYYNTKKIKPIFLTIKEFNHFIGGNVEIINGEIYDIISMHDDGYYVLISDKDIQFKELNFDYK